MNKTILLVVMVCGLVCGGLFAAVVLPEGPAPAALSAGYFPDRVHEFVWRNWNVVEPAKVAKILGTTEENVTAMAASMGLPPAATIPLEMKTRGYLSVLRRNWHLLPYSQLLELLEMTPETLDFKLREEDFLWIKLGSQKPKCEPLRYKAPDEAARRRADEIRRTVEKDFADLLRLPVEPRFDFVRQLGSPVVGYRQPAATDGSVELRFVYSYLAVFGDPLKDPDIDPYPDGFLQRLSSVGVNGIWLHVVLRDLAPGGETFPEFGEGHAQRLANLRRLVARAKRYGVSVFLYMNEPRSMPRDFFRNRPELAGVSEATEDRPGLPGVKGSALTALCTSCPEVRKWMSDALAYIFREVPDLGGIYAITASENLTSCASLGQWKDCRRCKDRTDTDIIAEVVATLEEGVHRGSPKAKVIVSDWGWKNHGDARDIVARLPKDVTLMSVSEWDLPIERGGVKSKVGEYSISAVGPGPRAPRHWDAAAKAGVGCAAEIQFNNTCELPTVPYLPVMDLVAEHLHNLAPHKPSAMLIGWTMGGHPSPNFDLARRMNRAQVPEVGTVLDQMACERFGAEGAPHARKAWTLLSAAYREYPYHVSVIYTCPVTWGAANPLYSARTGYGASMWGLPYDDLDTWRGPYPQEVYAAQFEKMAAGWQDGVEELRKAVEKAPSERRDEVRADLRYARAAGVTFRSVANQARFVIARDALAKASDNAERRRIRKDIRQILESEIALARKQYALVCEDSRIGFEPSCQYFYMPLDLLEKVVNCRWLQERYAEESAMETAQSDYVPETWNLDARKKFAEQRFGIFIHWGLYANYAQGEWYLEQGVGDKGLDESAYSRMKDGFCPSKFDAKEWVRVFKDAGAKYVTVTSRHHDGFSMWPTKADDGYNIANTPFKRDILGELAQACREAGLQLNFYYSLMDWHRPDYPTGHCVNARRTLKDRREDYASYKKFMMAQLTELLDGYHPGCIWFDGEWDHFENDSWTHPAKAIDWGFDDLYDLIHAKGALVANNNHVPIRPKEDIQLFERDLPGENLTGFDMGQTVVRDRPLEQCDVIQDDVWGYKIGERKFRTPEEVIAMVARAAAKGSNLLMNIGPDGSGRLPARAVEVMSEVGKWFAANGESIYGTEAGGVGLLKDVVSTRKGNALYLHFLNPAVCKFAFKLKGEVAAANCLADGSSVPVERTASGDAVVTIDRPAGCLSDVVVKLVVR